MSEILQIPLAQITPSPFNRKVVKDQELKDLAASIKANGVLEPLTVRVAYVPDDPDSRAMNPYELVFGERRYRAALLAKVEAVPCQVIEADDLKVLQLQYEENKHRSNPNPLDIADNFFHARTLGKSEVEIAKLYNVGKSYVYGLLALQRASENIREAVRSGDITASHAEVLIPLDEAISTRLLNQAHNLSVRELQDRVKMVTHKPTKKVSKSKVKSQKPVDQEKLWRATAVAQIIPKVKSITEKDFHLYVRATSSGVIRKMHNGPIFKTKTIPQQVIFGIVEGEIFSGKPLTILSLAKRYRVDVAKIKRELAAKTAGPTKPKKSPRGEKKK